MHHSLKIFGDYAQVLQARNLVMSRFPGKVKNGAVLPASVNSGEAALPSHIDSVVELVLMQNADEKAGSSLDTSADIYALLFNKGPTRGEVATGSIFTGGVSGTETMREKMYLGVDALSGPR